MKRFGFLCITMMIAILISLPAGALATQIMFDDLDRFSVITDSHWIYEDIIPGIDMDVFGLGGGITWDSTDYGLGVTDDEITGGGFVGEDAERLVFKFSKPIYISSFYLVDLFPNENNGADETGAFFYNETVSFGPGDSSGDLELIINTDLNHEIVFLAGSNPIDDFAIAGVNAAPVPEPSTIVLMGLGLVGLAGFGRKKFKE